MTTNRAQSGRLRLIGLTALTLALAVMWAAAPAGAAPVTIFKSGSYGFWGGSDGPNVCGKDFYSAYIQPVAPYISRTPAYPNHTQTIKTTTRVDIWNGAAWSVYKQDAGQTRTLSPGVQWTLFTPTASITVVPARYYRVVQFYEWRVNGVVVGRVTNLFDQAEYSAWNGWVAPTGTEASYCYIN